MTFFLRLLIFLFFSFIVNCQLLFAHIQDSLPKDTLKENPVNILVNLDSLSAMWYVKAALPEKFQSSVIVSSKLTEKEFNRKFSSLKLTVKVPYNEKLKQYIEKYLFEKKSQTEIMIGLMNCYSPVIERIVKANALPDEFKYLPLAESSLYNNAKSESGATGIWQLSFTNAKHYGLEVNSYVDERKDIKKASVAAVKNIIDLNKIYNDWVLSIAAFNTSPAIVNKAIRRAKGKMDFWSIYKYLPQESRDYVPAFIASVYLMNFYKDYQLKPVVIELPEKTDSVKILKQLYFKQVAAVLNIPYKQLCELNPVYKKHIVPERPEGYELALPVGYGGRFFLNKDSIYKYKDSTFKSYIKLPLNYKTELSPEDVKSTTEIYYIVKPNDNLGKIAKNYNVTVSELTKWNRLKGKSIKKGQKLRIIFSTSESKKQAFENTKKLIQESPKANIKLNDSIVKRQKYDSIIRKADDLFKLKKFNESRELYKKASVLLPVIEYPKSQIININYLVRNPIPKKDTVNDLRLATKDLRLSIDTTDVEKTSGFVLYKIKQGDVLGRIAKAFGMKLKDLMELNEFEENHIIKPGQKIKIRKLTN